MQVTVTDILDICEEPCYRIQVMAWKADGTWYWKDHDDYIYEFIDAAVTKAKEIRAEQIRQRRPGVRRLQDGVRVIDDIEGRAHWREGPDMTILDLMDESAARA